MANDRGFAATMTLAERVGHARALMGYFVPEVSVSNVILEDAIQALDLGHELTSPPIKRLARALDCDAESMRMLIAQKR